jgi:hypothetical protein
MQHNFLPSIHYKLVSSSTARFGNIPIPPNAGQVMVHIAEPLAQKQAKWMYHLSRLEYIPAAILSPLITNLQLQQSQMPLSQRQPIVRQEIMRQLFGITLNTLTFFAGGSLSTPLLRACHRFGFVSKELAGAPLSKFVGGMLASTLAFGFLRPLLINTALLKWMYESPTTAVPSIDTVDNGLSVVSQSSATEAATPKPSTSALSFMGAIKS